MTTTFFSERVHTFGEDESLVGIVTLPSQRGGDVEPSAVVPMSAVVTPPSFTKQPFVVLLNAGLVHRVGPFGMAVKLARALAQEGYGVLRFDQAGLGDSSVASQQKSLSIQARVVADGRAAMDFLATRYGATGFVIGGLCSGALNAHRICLADERVVGMWMLDGYAYPTPRAHRQLLVRRILKRVKNPGSLKVIGRRAMRTLRDRISRARATKTGAGIGTTPAAAQDDDRRAIFYQDWPAIEVARSEIEQMLARGVRAMFVYTGGWSTFVDRRQFDEMFPRLPRRDQIRVVYYPEADHTYLAVHDRALMVRDVGAFLSTVRLSNENENGNGNDNDNDNSNRRSHDVEHSGVP